MRHKKLKHTENKGVFKKDARTSDVNVDKMSERQYQQFQRLEDACNTRKMQDTSQKGVSKTLFQSYGAYIIGMIILFAVIGI